MIKCLKESIHKYLLFQKALLEFRSLTNRRRRLTKIDLMRIANRYVSMGGDLSFLDKPDKKIGH